MKIIEQSWSWIQKPVMPLETIELAGRTCYKSEDKITRDSASKFVKMLRDRKHHAMLEFGNAIVKFITNRGVTHELVRHRLCSFCLSGDTKILRYNQGRKHLTIKELYDRQFDDKLKGRNKLIKLRSITPNNVVIPNGINKVIKSGYKEVYEVRTKLGYNIKTSKNHIFFTPDGQIKLKNLNVGDNVFVNGTQSINIDKDWLYKKYHLDCESISNIANEVNCSYHTIRKYITKYGLSKKIGAKPQNFAPWNKGLTENDDDRIKNQANALRDNHHNNGYKEQNSNWKGNNLSSISSARCRFSRMAKIKCHYCGDKFLLENHHKDENPNNYKIKNKLTLCRKCHNLIHHGYNVKKVISDKITEIKCIGVEMTYDICMNSPYHNFIANGFVVHNSQESTRYCNYGGQEIEFIKPVWFIDNWEKDEACFNWYTSVRDSETAYNILIDCGWRPEQAREVLPNSLKTEICVNANLREWRHIFQLRTSPQAHPQIRELMISCLNGFKKEIPVLFDDINNE